MTEENKYSYDSCDLMIDVEMIQDLRINGYSEYAEELIQIHQSKLKKDFELIKNTDRSFRSNLTRLFRIQNKECVWCGEPTNGNSTTYCDKCREKKKQYASNYKQRKNKKKYGGIKSEQD